MEQSKRRAACLIVLPEERALVFWTLYLESSVTGCLFMKKPVQCKHTLRNFQPLLNGPPSLSITLSSKKTYHPLSACFRFSAKSMSLYHQHPTTNYFKLEIKLTNKELFWRSPSCYVLLINEGVQLVV